MSTLLDLYGYESWSSTSFFTTNSKVRGKVSVKRKKKAKTFGKNKRK